MRDVADYCPVHGMPMWYWPAGDEWSCQLPDCDATQPVRWAGTERLRSIRDTVLSGHRLAAMVAPPRSVFFVTGA
jgi:hypothetical protein